MVLNNKIIVPIEDSYIVDRIELEKEGLQKHFAEIDTSIKWVNSYDIVLVNIDRQLNYIQRKILENRISTVSTFKCRVELNRVNLGTRGYTINSIYLSFGEGGECVRRLANSISSSTGFQTSKNYIPHILLGRTEEDISIQEQYNLYIQIDNYSSNLFDLEGIKFDLSSPRLVYV